MCLDLWRCKFWLLNGNSMLVKSHELFFSPNHTYLHLPAAPYNATDLSFSFFKNPGLVNVPGHFYFRHRCPELKGNGRGFFWKGLVHHRHTALANKKGWETISHRITSYPCCVSTLGEFRRSWPYSPHPAPKVYKWFRGWQWVNENSNLRDSASLEFSGNAPNTV